MSFDRTVTSESLIVTRGLKTAAILAALYNAATKIGHGEKNPGPETITEAEAEAILSAQKHKSFDYLYGKRLKLDLKNAEKDGIVAGQYDFYYGRGTAKRAIEILKATCDPRHPDVIALQATSKMAVAARIGNVPRRTGIITEGNLADALGLTDPGDDPEVESQKYAYEKYREAPCTTINL